MQITTVCSIESKISDVTKYILHDDVYGKNEVSVLCKPDKLIFVLPTQTNCKLGCAFCHLNGTKRPVKILSSEWIESVVDHLLECHRVSVGQALLISFMGAGDPLMSGWEVINAIERLYNVYNGNFVKGIRFSVSTIMPDTAGEAMQIWHKWAETHQWIHVKFHLSVHGIFHSDRIVKRGISIGVAISNLKKYNMVTGNPIEYHYTLVDGVNDSIDELESFSALVAAPNNDKVTVKFLSLSETNGCKKSKLTEAKIRAMFPYNIVEFYDPPGRDVGASCGMFDVDIYNEDDPLTRYDFGVIKQSSEKTVRDFVCRMFRRHDDQYILGAVKWDMFDEKYKHRQSRYNVTPNSIHIGYFDDYDAEVCNVVLYADRIEYVRENKFNRYPVKVLMAAIPKEFH